MFDPRKLLAYIGLPVLALALLAGCGSGPKQGNLVPIIPPGSPAPPNTIPIIQGDVTFQAMADVEIQALRGQSFGGVPITMERSPILVTASIRHAGYLDTINTTYNQSNLAEVNPPRITEISALVDLSVEPFAPVLPLIQVPNFNQTPPPGPTPALFTAVEQLGRIQAVAGGPQLLNILGNYRLAEGYHFSQNVLDFNEAGDLSQFRGHLNYTPVENLWYHPLFRLPMMRPNTRFYGIGTVAEARVHYGFDIAQVGLAGATLGSRINMTGVATFVGWWPQVNVESFWPNDGNLSVGRWGFDYSGGDHVRYSGPPIHLTLASTANWPADQTIGWQEITMERVDALGSTTFTPGVGNNGVTTTEDPDIPGNNELRVYGMNAYTGGINTLPLGGNSFNPVANPDVLFYGPAGVGGGGATTVLRTLTTNASVFTFTLPNIIVLRDLALNALLGPTVVPGSIQVIVNPYDDPYIAFDPNNLTDGGNMGTYSLIDGSINVATRTFQVTPNLNQREDPAAPGWPPTLNDPRTTADGRTLATVTITYLETVSFGTQTPVVTQGEMLMIPADPLVPNAFYRVNVRARLVGGDPNPVTFDREWWFRAVDHPSLP